MSIIDLLNFDNLQFDIGSCTVLRKMWDKFGELFGIVNALKILQFDVELTTLYPHALPFIKDFLVQFNSFLSRLKACGKTRKYNERMVLVLSKIKGPY